MSKEVPELAVHKEWLGQIQQVGLVVSPSVLARNGVGINRQKSLDVQTRLDEIASDAEEPRVNTFPEFAAAILEWPVDILAGAPGGPDLPDSLTVALPEYEDRLLPSYALSGPEPNTWLALVSVVETGADLDALPEKREGWRASPHARLERLLRETAVSIGLLFNHTHLRLVYAPKGESSGHLTFRFKHVLETLGRPMAGALYALLAAERVTDQLPDHQRLPALLKESRKYQNEVSTRLAGQVLSALWELLRGFQRANDDTQGVLLATALKERPQDVYGGLLSTLMRLVFILYAEDRDLMPKGEVYQNHYSVSGLFKRLREDEARYPDTMDARYGAWAQLLALFRLIHDGGGHEALRFPPRHGRLFDPDAYPFLEGRPVGSSRNTVATIDPPRVADGVIFRVLRNLLILDGERLGERASPDQILDLKVCDPAMGSGAFLVEACRLLAERLVKAWEFHNATPKGVPPDEDALTFARRLVAERCLYGVDKNVFAVDLAKLSLWLATLARDHPFTFLDHALRHGDSLVGLSREQIACLNWEVKGQLPLLRKEIDARVATAQALRQRIQAMATSDDVPEKSRLLRDATAAIEDVCRVGDAVISAFFEREKPKDRQVLRVKGAADVESWLSNPAAPFRPSDPSGDRPTFHWEIEFPEVFTRTKTGFDAFIGNPPFMGGVKISSALTPPYLDFLHDSFAGAGGQADLVAFFFRRCFRLLKESGTLGFVSTNTVGQGDTRDSGLARVIAEGGVIYAAHKRFEWPGLAAVVVSVVHVHRGVYSGAVLLDERPVERIGAFLLAAPVDTAPTKLNEHGGKRAFLGSMVAGVGFILDYEDDDDTEAGKPSKKKKPWRYRWPDEIRDEVLGRLLELNADRAKSSSPVPGNTTVEKKRGTSTRAGPLLID